MRGTGGGSISPAAPLGIGIQRFTGFTRKQECGELGLKRRCMLTCRHGGT
jgi:hypothetical protein